MTTAAPHTLLVLFALALIAGPAAAQGAAISAPGPAVLGETRVHLLRAPDLAGRPWIAALSLGMEPGIAVDDRLVALAPDALFDATLGTSSPAGEFAGTLDQSGQGALTVAIPDDPALAGLTIHAAFAVFDSTAPSGIGAISNTIRRALVEEAPSRDFGAIDALLQATSDGYSFGKDGIGLVVVKDGEVLHSTTVGDLQPGDRVRLASATKWPSALAIARLADLGLLDLDDPVSLWLPEFQGDMAGITVRQCLAHVSGLPAQAPCLGDATTTLAACVSDIAQGPLPALPGAAFRYGGVSFQVAGRLVEVLTGLGWEAFFQLALAGPAGMSSYAHDGFGVTANPRIAGGGKAALEDYASLLELLLEGGAVAGEPILSTRAVLEVLAEQTGGAPVLSTPSPDAEGYGLGCWRDEVAADGRVRIASSPGAFGAYPWIDRERGYGAFILMERGLGDARALLVQLRPLLEQLFPVEAPMP